MLDFLCRVENFVYIPTFKCFVLWGKDGDAAGCSIARSKVLELFHDSTRTADQLDELPNFSHIFCYFH